MSSYTPDENGYLKVKTYRSGHFVFQIGLDFQQLEPFAARVNDAHIRFTSLPFVSEISGELEKQVMVSSIYGTNTIEGGELSYEETEEIIQAQDGATLADSERRITNLRNAYKLSEKTAKYIFQARKQQLEQAGQLLIPGEGILHLAEDMFKELHAHITDGLQHRYNKPTLYRDNVKGHKTQVGHTEKGGVYQPPKCKDDIQMLMHALCDWANCDAVKNLPALYRASLIHYYFELIHPFWDGNGRTGRVAEATILRASGYEYAPHAMSHYYLDNIQAYFQLLNQCRKAAEKKQTAPNTDFVIFFLKGMLSTINRLHDRANVLISDILMQARLEHLIVNQAITVRQHTILATLIANKQIRHRDKLKIQPWYKALYQNLTERTAVRDLKKLVDLQLIYIDINNTIHIISSKPKIKLSEHPHANIS